MSGKFRELISAKAEELFNLCDREQKGFIIKRDIQRLREELDVQPEQLEDVFDSLDLDHNGFLTLEEFTTGFGAFLSHQMGELPENESEQFVDEHLHEQEEDEHAFHQTLETLGATNLYDDEETIRGLWTKLRETDPILLRQFEQFIGKVTTEIKRSKSDHRTIEAALQNKSTVYDNEIKKLYEEMEQQIRMEKTRILEQEKLKERELKEQMEEQLLFKEQQLIELTQKQTDLERKFLFLNLNETETKNDNERLQKEKIQLEEQLQEITKDLEESKNYISQLKLQTKKEKRDRAKQTLNLTENMVMEREHLIKELDTLKILNQRLVDEHDLHQTTASSGRTLSPSYQSSQRRGSVLSDYFVSPYRLDETPEEDDELTQTRISQLGQREQPVGGNAFISHSELMNVATNAIPDRMFKIAFIGDSGVGKTSIIQRFCQDHFKEGFAATVGVDLQVKMIKIENQIIGLQIWDTAGQERFRSITRQYFRKSDGIILVYDVTSEITFHNVREWLSNVRELTDEDCLLVLVGNKIDLCTDDEQRPVKYKDGAKLADDAKCLFFESSARLGTSVIEIMESLARLMLEKDDRLRKGEEIINISKKTKKNFCC